MADPFRQMLEDLSQIAEIPTERLWALGNVLEEQTQMMTTQQFIGLISEAVPDDTQGSAVYSMLNLLSPDGIPDLLEYLKKWREASEGNQFSLPKETYRHLEEKLPVLIRNYPALDRMQKVRALASVLGNEVEDFLFVCDARPIYNEDRTDIEAIVPVTTLKLTYERQNGDTDEIELVFAEEQLSEFVEEAQKAEKKLQVLRAKAKLWMTVGVDREEEVPDADKN